MLKNFFAVETIDFQQTLEELLSLAERIRPMLGDVPRMLFEANARGENLLFEGAQGTLLDIDHGTYPYVTSSNCVAGAAAAGSGVGPQLLHYVLGITKAYTTRDAAALKRSIQINGVSGLCVTKLDVLDGVETLQLGVGYRLGGQRIDILPVGAESLSQCEPEYEEIPGWSQSTVGVRDFDALPENAIRYLRRIEEICGVPIDLISTGPDRDETIVLRHPFRSEG